MAATEIKVNTPLIKQIFLSGRQRKLMLETTLYTDKDDKGENIVWVGNNNVDFLPKTISEMNDMSNHFREVAAVMANLGRVVECKLCFSCAK